MLIILLIAGYLLGSLPFARLIKRAADRVDWQQFETDNAGKLDVVLGLGQRAGVWQLLGEVLKGFIAVGLARLLADGYLAIGVTVLAMLVGTRWPFWKGTAGTSGTAAGVAALLAVSAVTLVCTLLLWFGSRLYTHSSYTAKRITLVLWPLLLGLFTRSVWAMMFGVLFSAWFLFTSRGSLDDPDPLEQNWPDLLNLFAAVRRQFR